MARYTGPSFKKARRYGMSLLENGKEFNKGKKRTTPPGQHGARRVKLSDFGLHLHEKQKVKYMYGVNERQMVKVAKLAQKNKGVTGTVILQLLESRLDNFVYRAGFATTRRQARQLVSHGHFTKNGKKADIASMHVSIGDFIELKKKSQTNNQITDSLENKKTAEWISRDKFKATLDRLPERRELNKEINEALVVEYYSK